MNTPIDLISPSAIPTATSLSRDYIEHFGFTIALNAIKEAHASYGSGDRPINVRIQGVSGVGKTSAFAVYAKRHPMRKNSHGTVVPVVLVSVPAQPTSKALYTNILRSLGANEPGSGTAEHQRARIVMLFKACRVELLLIDEIQHFIDRGTARSHAAVADALKSLLDELDIPCVLGGAPRSSKLFDLNNQLRNRFTRVVALRPFDGTTEEGLLPLMGFLAALLDSFDESIKSFLLDPQIAQRLFYATDGVPRLIVDFLLEFRKQVSSYKHQPSWETASDVFRKVFWMTAPDDRDPFSMSFFASRLTGPGEPYSPDSQDGDNHA